MQMIVRPASRSPHRRMRRPHRNDRISTVRSDSRTATQAVACEEIRIVQEGLGLEVEGDLALVENERPSTCGERERQIVGHDQLRLRKRREKFRQLVTPKRIDPRCRLVEHENLRTHRKHRRHGCPASLAPAQVVRCLLCQPGGADVIKGLLDATSDLHSVKPQVRRPEGDVVSDPVHKQLIIRILEDEAHLPPDLGKCVILQNEPTDHDFARWRSSPLRCSARVVFPEPLGPSSATRSPDSIVMSRPSKTGWCSPGYVKARSSMASAALTSAPRSRGPPRQQPSAPPRATNRSASWPLR